MNPFSHKAQLKRTFERVGPLAREDELTGPHHVGTEVDLEFQASFHSAWTVFSRIFLLATAGFAAYSVVRKGDVPNWAWFGMGFGAAGSILSAAMSKTVASRSVTEAPQSLRAMIGPTGYWEPVGQPGEPIEVQLPNGQIIHPQPALRDDVVTFRRYGRPS